MLFILHIWSASYIVPNICVTWKEYFKNLYEMGILDYEKNTKETCHTINAHFATSNVFFPRKHTKSVHNAVFSHVH